MLVKKVGQPLVVVSLLVVVIIGFDNVVDRARSSTEKVPSIAVTSPVSLNRSSMDGATRSPDSTFTRPDDVEPRAPSIEVRQPASGLGVVPGLTRATGVLERRSDDFYLNGREIDFGPERWLKSEVAPTDLDGDRSRESWLAEIVGLIGSRVVILGDVDDDDIDVFEVNDANLRPLFTEVAPWSEEWRAVNVDGSAAEKLDRGITADAASRIALARVPGIVISALIDVNDGHPYWELDVRSRDGSLFDIEIDAVTGEVVEIDLD